MTATQPGVGVGSGTAKVVLDAQKIVAPAAMHLQWCPILGVPAGAAQASRCTRPCLKWLWNQAWVKICECKGEMRRIWTLHCIFFWSTSPTIKVASRLLSIRKIKKQQFRLSIARLVIASTDGSLLKMGSDMMFIQVSPCHFHVNRLYFLHHYISAVHLKHNTIVIPLNHKSNSIL
jgi:hypothetical protein